MLLTMLPRSIRPSLGMRVVPRAANVIRANSVNSKPSEANLYCQGGRVLERSEESSSLSRPCGSPGLARRQQEVVGPRHQPVPQQIDQFSPTAAPGSTRLIPPGTWWVHSAWR